LAVDEAAIEDVDGRAGHRADHRWRRPAHRPRHIRAGQAVDGTADRVFLAVEREPAALVQAVGAEADQAGDRDRRRQPNGVGGDRQAEAVDRVLPPQAAQRAASHLLLVEAEIRLAAALRLLLLTGRHRRTSQVVMLPAPPSFAVASAAAALGSDSDARVTFS